MNKYGVYFLEFADSVEVYAGECVPQEYLDKVEKSLTDGGFEKIDGKSRAKFMAMKSVDLSPLEKSNDLADQVIDKLAKRASESVTKDEELPYWHPKAKLANARRVREMERQQRYKQTVKPPATPQPNVPQAPTPGVPPILAGGTGRKYANIPDYKKAECTGEPDCKCEQCNVEKSGYGPKGSSQYTPADNVRRKQHNVGAERVGGQSVKSYTRNAFKHKEPSGPASKAKLYTPAEIETYKKRMNKSLEWTEHELANKIAKLPMFNNQPPRQPTNEEMFGGMAVSEEQAQVAQTQFDNKFTDFFKEVQKPIGDLRKFASEEEEIAYWRSLRVAPPTGGEGQN